jgi:hypothetical protein
VKLIKRINTLIQKSENESHKPNAYRYLPEIVETLKSMRELLDNRDFDNEKRQILVRGLGRIVTDDFQFSESPLDTNILETASDFLRLDD